AKSEVTDEAITDENGYFEFPDMYQSASEFGGVVRFIIFQSITLVNSDGTQKSIWRGTKDDGVVGGENRGNTWVVDCELANDERIVKVNGASFHTICRWDVIEDEKDDYSNRLFDQ
ncbi:MAG: DUF6795 domain-containing protein, partial [Cellvibrio sp.]